MELTDYIEAPSDEDQQLALEMQRRAVHLLSLREHGSMELELKLKQKFPQAENRPELVDFVLDVCRKNNWLSDKRFIESYIRQAIEKGHGPFKIRQSLSTKTGDEATIDTCLSLDDREWAEMAQIVLDKKYGSLEKPKEAKELARRMRFLQSRGFSQSQIYKAFITDAW